MIDLTTLPNGRVLPPDSVRHLIDGSAGLILDAGPGRTRYGADGIVVLVERGLVLIDPATGQAHAVPWEQSDHIQIVLSGDITWLTFQAGARPFEVEIDSRLAGNIAYVKEAGRQHRPGPRPADLFPPVPSPKPPPRIGPDDQKPAAVIADHGIQSARKRMRGKHGSGREIKQLPKHLWECETVLRMLTGQYGKGHGVVVMTDRRILCLQAGLMNTFTEDFPYSKITSVQWNSSWATGTLTLFASGNRVQIKGVNRDDGKELADALRARLAISPT